MELKKIGASLYLCEGTRARIDSRGRMVFAVEFTNKDPRLIKMFMLFLRQVVGAMEKRIKCQLFIYPDLNEELLKRYWSRVSGIGEERFQKSILLKQKNVKYKPNKLGTLKIRYFHKEHFLKIQGIITEVFGEVA